MSSYRRTEMTHPGSETIEQATARLPIQRVIQGTKRGSIESMIILSHRINDSYANYASEILDALLPHLNRPPAIAQVRHTTSALTAMNVLGDVFQWYKNHPMPSPASRITAARIHEYLDNFVYWTRRLLDGCHASPDAAASVNGYDTIGRFLYTILLTPGDIPHIVSKNTTVLGAAVDLATHLFQGFPIIHPRGRPSDPSADQPDAASAVLFMLARDNPRGVVEVVNQGTICTTETFVERIVQRMRCYDSLSKGVPERETLT